MPQSSGERISLFLFSQTPVKAFAIRTWNKKSAGLNPRFFEQTQI